MHVSPTDLTLIALPNPFFASDLFDLPIVLFKCWCADWPYITREAVEFYRQRDLRLGLLSGRLH